MLLYLIIALIIFILGLFLYKKRSYNLPIKDYSSSKLQNRTFFQNIEDGFSFDVRSVDKKQLHNDIFILKKVLKFATTIPKEKKFWINKLISNIKNKKISFNNGITYDKAINIINLSTDDIADLVHCDKKRILSKVFPISGDNLNFSDEEINNLTKQYGISGAEIQDWISQMLSIYYVSQGFISDEQYKNLLENYLENADMKNSKDIEKLSKKLNALFTEEQRKIIKDKSLKTKDLAFALLFYGEYTIYRMTKLKHILPDYFFDDKKREPIIKVLKGYDDVDIETKTVIKNSQKIPLIKEFISNVNIKNAVKNIFYIDAFDNHDKILNSLKFTEKRFIKIPTTLVNFDLFPDIYVNKIPTGNLANWINIAIKDYHIKDIYWVIPEHILSNQKNIDHFFSENTSENIPFYGNYNINKVYKDLSKPLSQKFLIDIENATIISRSSNYSKSELNSHIKTGKYRIINIHTCTSKNLPKIKKDFILSVDADYFISNGYDSAFFLEHIPFNLNKYLNEFLNIWKTKLSKASLVFLSISPEFIGFSKTGEIRGFYEYLIKTVSKYSKKYY